jgi:hypothetical protein
MSQFQVRGCCCGIPFGCGVLLVVLFASLLWKLIMPGHLSGHLWPSGAGQGLAFMLVPGVVLAVSLVAGTRRR